MANTQNITVLDQAALTWTESQAASIERRVRQEKLANIVWPELVQVDREMSPDEDMLISYIGRPGTGRMAPLSAGGEDLPSVDVEFDRLAREAYAQGISYSFTDQEIGRARKLGINLRADKVRAAFRTANEYLDDLVMFGSTDYGWSGLFNFPTTGTGDTARHLSETAWAATDTTAPFETIRKAYNEVWAGSDMIYTPDTLLVPPKALTFLTQMIKTSAGITSVSVWDYIQQNNPYTKMNGRPLMIKAVNQLDSAGPSGAPRMVLYSSDMDAMRLILPQELTFLPPQRVAYSQKFYGYMKTGGLQVLHPKSICIIDGFGANL